MDIMKKLLIPVVVAVMVSFGTMGCGKSEEAPAEGEAVEAAAEQAAEQAAEEGGSEAK